MTKDNYTGKDGLTEVDMEVEDSRIVTWYCLQCPCGKFSKEACNRDGEISLTNCPRSDRHSFVYYNPKTGECYEKDLTKPQKQPTTCEIQVMSTYLQTSLTLKDLLVIPQGWTLEIETNDDYDDYLNLDMEIDLHRIPDQQSYDQWEHEKLGEKRRQERENEVAHLRARLKQLTGEDA